MITLKTPIELICNTAMSPSYEAFYHRITGNYEIMASGITGEDLLHVVTAPPEVYLAEGGITNLANNTQINSKQETQLEIINNLLNRIVLNVIICSALLSFYLSSTSSLTGNSLYPLHCA